MQNPGAKRLRQLKTDCAIYMWG